MATLPMSHTGAWAPWVARCLATKAQLGIQKSILSAASRGDAEAVLKVLGDADAGHLSPVNVATAAHRLAKLRLPRALKERSLQHLEVGR